MGVAPPCRSKVRLALTWSLESRVSAPGWGRMWDFLPWPPISHIFPQDRGTSASDLPGSPRRAEDMGEELSVAPGQVSTPGLHAPARLFAVPT